MYRVEISTEARLDIDRQMRRGHYSAADFVRFDLSTAIAYLADYFDDLPVVGPGVRSLSVTPDAAVTCPHYRLFVARSVTESIGIVIVAVDIGPQTVDP